MDNELIFENQSSEISFDVPMIGGSVNMNYSKATNKPSINGVVLEGNKTTEELGITQDVENYINENKEMLKGKDGVDGKDGYTPERGTDYWTEEDVSYIENYCKDYIDETITSELEEI